MTSASLTSDELNFLVYRYLLESGFVHSAFTFGHESLVSKSSINGMEVPPGALISFVQRGLQYCEIEAHVQEDGTEILCDEPFSVLAPHTCRVKSKKRVFEVATSDAPADTEYGAREIVPQQVTVLEGHQDVICTVAWNPQGSILASGSSDGTARLWEGSHGQSETSVVLPHSMSHLSAMLQTQSSSSSSSLSSSSSSSNSSSSFSSSQVSSSSSSSETKPSDSDVTMSDVSSSSESSSSANPTSTSSETPSSSTDSLSIPIKQEPVDGASTSSSDSTHLTDSAMEVTKTEVAASQLSLSSSPSATISPVDPAVLSAASSLPSSVVSMDWSADGQSLVTGNYNGSIAIWSAAGAVLSHQVWKHHAPVTVVRFNKSSTLVASASLDRSILVIDVASGNILREFKKHNGAVLDLSWRDDTCFASSGSDAIVYVFNITQEEPVAVFERHEKEVNSVRWSPRGDVLASSSDDMSVKIWNPETKQVVVDMRDHGREVTAVRFSSILDSSRPLLLASASMDTTVKVYDADRGRCLFTLSEHSYPVTLIEFSPNSDILASVGHDRIHFWSTKDGKMLKTYRSGCGINDVCWSPSSDRIALCLANNTVAVVQL